MAAQRRRARGVDARGDPLRRPRHGGGDHRIDPLREPKVSKVAAKVTQGSLDALRKASNAIILGDALAAKLGVRVGQTVVIATGTGATMLSQVVGLYHSGMRFTDESAAFTLLKTAQILAGQTGLVNELRVRLDDVMAARDVALRIEAQTGINRCRGRSRATICCPPSRSAT